MKILLPLLEPRNGCDVVIRLGVTLLLVSVGNLAYSEITNQTLHTTLQGHFLHALFVVGPLVLAFFSAMYQQHKLRRSLAVLSRQDGLTGLNNRRNFIHLANNRRTSCDSGVLLLLDADNFKQINDQFGHQTGDICLQRIASELEQNIRQNDVLGRIGGEEFAIFLCNTTLDQARTIGERLTKPIHFRQTPNSVTADLQITLSVGATLNCPSRSLDTLLAEADQALYQAKADGRARIVMWHDLQASTLLS